MTIRIRRREIHIETHELTIISGLSDQPKANCSRCNDIVTAFTFEEVSAFLPHADLKTSLEHDDLHMAAGSLICGNSLSRKKISGEIGSKL